MLDRTGRLVSNWLPPLLSPSLNILSFCLSPSLLYVNALPLPNQMTAPQYAYASQYANLFFPKKAHMTGNTYDMPTGLGAAHRTQEGDQVFS